MTFNTLFTGGKVTDGLAKVAATILELNPDIALIEEVTNTSTFDKLLDVLGRNSWSGVTRKGSGYLDVGIVTRHTIDMSTVTEIPGVNAIGAQISVSFNTAEDGRRGSSTVQRFSVWCIHYDYENDGSRNACNKKIVSPFQLLAGEANLNEPAHYGRLTNALIVSRFWPLLDQLDASESVPVIYGGDFNSPSHLDWVESTRNTHCNWTFQWPATMMLEENLGLTDSYREIFPDPDTQPGHTWSSFEKQLDTARVIPSPQERIDMIHYKGRKLKPVDAHVYKGHRTIVPFPFETENNYPSDHKLLYVDFEVDTD